jgi:hypothetical protein
MARKARKDAQVIENTEALVIENTETQTLPQDAQTLPQDTATEATDGATDAVTDEAAPIVGVTDETAPEATDEATDEAPVKKGTIVPNHYKAQYKKYGNSCGDEMANVFATLVKTKTGTDLVKLRQIGTQNGIDVESRWGHLNVGQQRMNLGNVLRNRLKNAERVVIGTEVWNDEALTEAA